VSWFFVAFAGVVLSAPISWLHDEEKAARQSHATGRPMLIDFRAEWCSACKMMDRHTWTDPAVQDEVKARFVPVSLDVSEESSATGRLTKRYGIAGLPTVMIMVCKKAHARSGAGAACEGQGRTTGYVPPSEMLELLRAVR
jgi:thioredoxin:protein disulfide reductase